MGTQRTPGKGGGKRGRGSNANTQQGGGGCREVSDSWGGRERKGRARADFLPPRFAY